MDLWAVMRWEGCGTGEIFGGAVSELPMPPGWGKRSPAFWVIGVLTAAAGVYCAGKAVLAAAQAFWIAAAIAACAAAVLLISAVAVAFVTVGRNRLRTSVDETGTTLATAWAKLWWLAAWFAAVIVGLTLFMFYGGRLGGWAADFRVRSVGWSAIALVAAVVGLGGVVRASHREPPRLRLSGEGVDLLDATGRFTLSWNDITNITGEAPSVKGFHSIAFEHGNGASSVIATSSAYAPDEVVLYWLIRHYWLHPEARAELTNGAAPEILLGREVNGCWEPDPRYAHLDLWERFR